MKPFLRSQLERYAQRLGELDFLLSRDDIMADMAQYRILSREHAEVTAIAGRYRRYLQRESDWAGAQEMLADEQPVAFLFQLAKTGVADARIEGLWENAPSPANDLTKVRWTE